MIWCISCTWTMYNVTDTAVDSKIWTPGHFGWPRTSLNNWGGCVLSKNNHIDMIWCISWTWTMYNIADTAVDNKIWTPGHFGWPRTSLDNWGGCVLWTDNHIDMIRCISWTWTMYNVADTVVDSKIWTSGHFGWSRITKKYFAIFQWGFALVATQHQ